MGTPDAHGCMPWLGARSTAGYGRFQYAGQLGLAHRAAYEVFIGPIADNLTLDHTCRNTWCVNPTHLEPVSLRENILRSDGVTAINARKTECDYGHPFDATNTVTNNDGERVCRICKNRRQREWKARSKAAAAGQVAS